MDKIQVSHPTDRPEARILDLDGARKLVAEGWGAADLHVHTLHSHDVIPTRLVDPLTLYHKARRLGMTYVAFTDHDYVVMARESLLIGRFQYLVGDWLHLP